MIQLLGDKQKKKTDFKYNVMNRMKLNHILLTNVFFYDIS